MRPASAVVRLFADVLRAPSFTLSWLPAHTFPLTEVTAEQKDVLTSVIGLEVHFVSPDADDRAFVREFVLSDSRPCYLFAIEPFSEQRSRVRTHKGYFWRSRAIKSGPHAELEAAVAEGYTHFVGIARVTEQNVRDCSEYFGEGERSCMISASQEELPSTEIARSILASGPRLPGAGYINYLELVTARCPLGDYIYRMAGYSGEGDASFQIFAPRTDLEMLRDRITSLL